MNYRLTIAAALAVILASISEFALISGGRWLVESAGAVLVVALAGLLTRLSPVPSAVGATVLSAAATAPMLAAQPLYFKLIATVVIGCCAGSASGLRLFRTIAADVTYVAALLLYLNVLHAGPQSLVRVIPTTASLRHLVHLATSGASLAKYSPPVAGTHGVALLAAASIGAAAIIVDFVAVRLRKPAIAGLPLLVIYLAPIATTAKVSGPGAIFTFVLAATGYLALLSSDGRSRLRGWGRVVTVWHQSGDERAAGADIGGLAATGRRIGLAAVCAAIVVPLLLPSLNLHRIFSGFSGGKGAVPVGFPNPVDEMNGLLARKSAQTVLSYQSNGASGGNYLQVYVLNYDRDKGLWDLVPPTRSAQVTGGPLQQAPGLNPSTVQQQIFTTIKLGQVNGYWWKVFFLPVPYWPMRLSVAGNWREADGTLMVYSGEASHSGQTYTVTNGEVTPTPAQLTAPQQIPAPIRQAYLGFQSPQTAQLTKIALRITKGKTTAFGRAVALEQWFHTSRFSYSLHPPAVPNTAQGLLTFLTTTRQGYCQQYAFAMAVLARLVGIPSRVAVGYTAGTEHADGTWVVTSADAHAWPELYFSGIGWLRFEPTPGGSGGQDSATQPSYVTAALPGHGSKSGPGSKNGNSHGPSPSTSASAHPFYKKVPFPTGSAGTGAVRNSRSAAPIGWSVLAVFVLLAAAPGLVRMMSRRRRWSAARDDESLAHAAWQELCADLDDYGLTCQASESPRAIARRIGSEAGLSDDARSAVRRIAIVVERARYAPVPEAADTVRADVKQVRRSLARSAGLTARWRARLLPASTLSPLRAAVRQGLGLLTGWMPAQGEGTLG